MASAERTYLDPSVLLKLYIHEPESAAMNAWRTRITGALPITLHGRLEIANGISLAAYRKAITTEAMADALLSFEEDLAEARYTEIDVLWRATLKRGCRHQSYLHSQARVPFPRCASCRHSARARAA